MKRTMIAAGIAALLLGTAGESRAETTYVENVVVTSSSNLHSAEAFSFLEFYVVSNNLTCGPKKPSEKQLVDDSWVFPISSVCSEKQLARLEKNDVWFRIKQKPYPGMKTNKDSDIACKGQHFKYQTGSGGTVKLSYNWEIAIESKEMFNMKLYCN